MGKYATKLNKEILMSYGIIKVTEDDEVTAVRFNKKGKMITTTIPICQFVRQHKYTQPKVYPGIQIMDNVTKRNKSIALGRLKYAWFIGEVPEGMVVDHIDNDPFNNKLENLQLLSAGENIAKRFKDNPLGCSNQFDAIKRWKK